MEHFENMVELWARKAGQPMKCRRYDRCAAPLCPMEAETEESIWYASEPICRLKRFQSLDWIRKQKRIQKLALSDDGYFTVQMLQAIRQVRKGIKGINSDQALVKCKSAEQKWASAHKKVQRVEAKRIQKAQ